MEGHPTYPELGLWATVYKETGQFIGRCGLLPQTIEGRREVEVAYLIDKAYWGASEVARALVDYACERLGIDPLDLHDRAWQPCFCKSSKKYWHDAGKKDDR